MSLNGDWTIFGNLAAALLAGLLIGVERGWSMRDREAGGRVAGFRTFGLIACGGFVVAIIAEQLGYLIAALILVPLAAMLAWGYVKHVRAPDGLSITNFVASMLTLAFGIIAGAGFPAQALAGAAAVTGLLSLRTELHAFLRRLGPTDVKALARFGIIALVILPFLPDQSFGPYQALNPRQLWYVVVLVTGLSFTGYVANRLIGATHGTTLTAVIGGAYSSTAVTVWLAGKLRDGEGDPMLLSGAIALASGIMYLRILVMTLIFANFLTIPLLLIFVPGILVALFAGLFMLQKGGSSDLDMPVETRNPVNLGPALFFAATVAVTLIIARWADARYGSGGIAVTTFIVGSLDIDAAIIMLGDFTRGKMTAEFSAFLLALGTLVNMLVKTGLATATAGWKNGRWATAAIGSSSAALGVAALSSYLMMEMAS